MNTKSCIFTSGEDIKIDLTPKKPNILYLIVYLSVIYLTAPAKVTVSDSKSNELKCLIAGCYTSSNQKYCSNSVSNRLLN